MREGDDAHYISTLRAAGALGVSQSTIKRWVDDGVLPAHRTAGGHRKLLRSEVLALARQGEFPRRDLSELTAASNMAEPLGLQSVSSALLSALLRGDATEVSALIRRAYHSGTAVEALADEIVAPAMAQVGLHWQTARIDVWREHRATQLTAAALYELKDELESRAERNRPVAIGGAPDGDPYVLATLLAQMALLDSGWESVNLGPNTPLASLAKAMRELRPRLVWLSVSYLERPGQFVSAYRDFYRLAETMGVAVAVGGQALVEPVRSALSYTTYGDGLKHLAAFARTLNPRPRRPRRGRPSRR